MSTQYHPSTSGAGPHRNTRRRSSTNLSRGTSFTAAASSSVRVSEYPVSGRQAPSLLSYGSAMSPPFDPCGLPVKDSQGWTGELPLGMVELRRAAGVGSRAYERNQGRRLPPLPLPPSLPILVEPSHGRGGESSKRQRIRSLFSSVTSRLDPKTPLMPKVSVAPIATRGRLTKRREPPPFHTPRILSVTYDPENRRFTGLEDWQMIFPHEASDPFAGLDVSHACKEASSGPNSDERIHKALIRTITQKVESLASTAMTSLPAAFKILIAPRGMTSPHEEPHFTSAPFNVVHTTGLPGHHASDVPFDSPPVHNPSPVERPSRSRNHLRRREGHLLQGEDGDCRAPLQLSNRRPLHHVNHVDSYAFPIPDSKLSSGSGTQLTKMTQPPIVGLTPLPTALSRHASTPYRKAHRKPVPQLTPAEWQEITAATPRARRSSQPSIPSIRQV